MSESISVNVTTREGEQRTVTQGAGHESLMQVLYEGLADSKYRPCPLLAKYVEAGWLGRKTGRGFYDYAGEMPVPTR